MTFPIDHDYGRLYLELRNAQLRAKKNLPLIEEETQLLHKLLEAYEKAVHVQQGLGKLTKFWPNGKGYEWFLGLLIVIALIAIISLVEDDPFKPGNDFGILVLMIFIGFMGLLIYEERRREHKNF